MRRWALVGKNIRAARRAKDLSQGELAKLCGVGRVTIARWESGIFLPGPDGLAALSKALSLPTRLLLDAEFECRKAERVKSVTEAEKLFWIAGRMQEIPDVQEDEAVTAYLRQAQEILDRASVELVGKPAEAWIPVRSKLLGIVRKIDERGEACHQAALSLRSEMDRRAPPSAGSKRGKSGAQKAKKSKRRDSPRPK